MKYKIHFYEPDKWSLRNQLIQSVQCTVHLFSSKEGKGKILLSEWT